MTVTTHSQPSNTERIGIARWRSLVSNSFVPLDVEPAGEEFVGSLAPYTLDDVSVFDLAATPHTVRRTVEHIARDQEPYYKLSLQMEGSAALTQDGRTAQIHPGDLAIYDTSRPYELSFTEDNRALIFLVPQRIIDLPQPSVAQVTAVVFSRESTLGRVIIPFLSQLGSSLETLDGPQGRRMVHSALDLLVTLLSSELHMEADPRRALAKDVRSYIDARLSDPGLTPTTIAQAHFISTRHLHAIFSADGVSVASWIRERRLDRIRRELADPLHARESLQQVAARWGLPDAAHFSKLFRAHFGLSPSEYRRQILKRLHT